MEIYDRAEKASCQMYRNDAGKHNTTRPFFISPNCEDQKVGVE